MVCWSEPEQAGQIADALSRLVEQPALRHALATHARQRAVDCFGRDRFLKEFQTLLWSESSD